MTKTPGNNNSRTKPAAPASGSGKPQKFGLARDVLWGRPIFKAPDLPNTRVKLDPSAFVVPRVTERPRH